MAAENNKGPKLYFSLRVATTADDAAVQDSQKSSDEGRWGWWWWGEFKRRQSRFLLSLGTGRNRTRNSLDSDRSLPNGPVGFS